MPARQLLDGRGRVEQVLVAHRAVGLRRVLPALMLVVQRERHARVALHAVEAVQAQTLALRGQHGAVLASA